MKIKVFIENEAGKMDKNIHDEQTLEYTRTMKVAREYPYPYGFILDTTAEDGGGVDCFVITDQPLKRGEIIECEVLALMECIESSTHPLKKGVLEADANVLAVLPGENSVLTEEIKEGLSDFSLNFLVGIIEGWSNSIFGFESAEEANAYIERRLNTKNRYNNRDQKVHYS